MFLVIPCFDIRPSLELGYNQVFLIDKSDGEPPSQTVNVKSVVTGVCKIENINNQLLLAGWGREFGLQFSCRQL